MSRFAASICSIAASRVIPSGVPSSSTIDGLASDRVVVAGLARGKVKATSKPFEDHWIFAFTVRDGKLSSIREYVDTQALARASQADTIPTPSSIDSGAVPRVS